MTSGADLFVVCKQCGSEVSPYITECPYCGHRLRRRAPKLPPVNAPARTTLRGRARSLLTRSTPARVRPVRARTRTGGARNRPSRWAADRPYATIALVAASCAAWVAEHAEGTLYLHMAVLGPLNGDWWRLFTSEFAYVNGVYAFVAILTIAIFGWLFERRHGPAAVLALFLGAGATGALVAGAAYQYPLVSGGNGAALALLAAWAAPDLLAARAGDYREGDLLGAGALAALLLALPFARPEASWLAGVVGGLLGLAVGLGMHRLSEQGA
jgi:membrane associated rhomboid family serine protease